MLVAYYSKGCDSEKMFSNLEIGKSRDFRMNQYNVIHFDIQWCIEPAGGPEHVVEYISEQVIGELNQYYPNILAQDTVLLPDALRKINEKTGTRFVVIKKKCTSHFLAAWCRSVLESRKVLMSERKSSPATADIWYM